MAGPEGTSIGRKARVLVVEDEFLFAAMLMYMLAELGFDCVGPVGDVAAAVAAAKAEIVDAALVSAALQGAAEIVASLTALGIPFGVVVENPLAGAGGPFDGVPLVRKPADLADVRRLLENLLPGWQA